MFVVAVEFVVDEDHVDAFRQQVLLQAANSLQLEEACRVFDVCFDPECPTYCFLCEVWIVHTKQERYAHTRNGIQPDQGWVS